MLRRSLQTAEYIFLARHRNETPEWEMCTVQVNLIHTKPDIWNEGLNVKKN